MICTSTFSDKWPIVKLGDVVNFLDHKRVPVTKSDRTPGEYQYYGANGSQGTINNYIFDEPLVLLAEDGGNFGHETRSIAYIAKGKYWVNNHAHVLQPKEFIDLDYLYRVLARYDVTPFIKGATRAKLSKTDASRIPIPLPPLEIQKKIAMVLEKADQLRKDCQKMEQELNSLAQSVFIELFGDPVTNPKGWEVASLDSLAKVQIGPFGSQLHKEDYISDGVPLINPTHIVKGSIIPDTNLTLTVEKFNTLPNYHLMLGDIIMGRRGEMGRTALIDDTSKGWFCGTGSLFIRPKSKIIQSVYLNSVMSCSSMKAWLEEQSLGATMPNLNKKILHSIQVPIPSEDLQTNYAIALDTLKNQRLAHKQQAKELNSLFSALMQKAFKGELNL